MLSCIRWRISRTVCVGSARAILLAHVMTLATQPYLTLKNTYTSKSTDIIVLIHVMSACAQLKLLCIHDSMATKLRHGYRYVSREIPYQLRLSVL